MATASFSVALSIEDSLFGKDIQFANRRVELWIKGDSYDELVGEGYTDNYIYVYFNFDLEYKDVLVLPVVYFKIFDKDEVVSYTFPAPSSEGKTVTLAEGENNLTALVKLKDSDTAVTNEVVECNAVLTDEDGNPYSNVSVSVNIQDGATVIQELGTTEPNPLGFFGYTFVKDRDLSALIHNNAADLQFRYRYYGANGELLDEQNKLFSAIKDFRNLLILRINLPQQKLINSETIDNLATAIGLTIPSNLQDFFGSTGIATLRNIRSFGGLKRIPALQDPIYDQAVITRLDGHAQLETLSGDFTANDHVINQGYNAVYKVALASRSAFTSKVVLYGTLSDFEAAKMHQIASAHSRLFQTVYTNYKNQLNFADFVPNPSFQNILDEINDKCNCDECEAAISPIAYLADLIEYVHQNLYIKLTPTTPPIFGFPDGSHVTPEMLKQIFCNDFCLTEDYCDLMHEKICQYRIAIETLHCFYEHLTSPTSCQVSNFNKAERRYLITAYFTLLEQMGTTYFEVRDVKNSNDLEKKKELADRLGIAFVEVDSTPDFSTDILYFDPYDTNLDNEAFNIQLETIFGFRDYTRGCNSNPINPPYIKEWKEEFLRLQWKKNDSNQDAYSLATPDNPKPILDPDIVTIDDFKDPDISSPSDALQIWLNRKEFIEEIWNDVFRANQTPHGAEKGERYITVDGNHVAEFPYGKRFILVDTNVSPDAEYTFTAEYAEEVSGDTRIHVLEKIENAVTGIDWKVRFLDSSEISLVSGSDITISDSTVDWGTVDVVEIIASPNVFNGVYTVQSGTGATVTVTPNPVSWTPTPPAYADLYFYRTIDVVEAYVETSPAGYIRLQSNVETELENNYWGTLSNSENNDGKYTILNISTASDPDIPESYTQFEVSEQLAETADDGEFTYLSEELSPVTIQPNYGTRFLQISSAYHFYDALNMDVSLDLYLSGSTTPIPLTIDSIVNGDGVNVSEILSGNETGGTVKIKIDAGQVGFNPNEFIVASNYQDFFDSLPGASLPLHVNIGGIDYEVSAVLYDDLLGESTFTLLSAPSPSGDVIIDFGFSVTGVDISGRKFTIPAPLLPDLAIDTDTINAIKGSKNIAIAGDLSSPPNNNGKYTLKSVSAPYEDTGLKIDLFVEEVVWNEAAISPGTLKYKEKTVPLFYQHPKIQAIFGYLQTNDLSYPVGSLTPVEITLWEDAPTVEIADFIEYRDTLLAGTDTAQINTILGIIENDLYLTRDSFIRLANIAEKYSLEITAQSTDRVTQDEYTELFNILISAVKKAYQTDWYNEEEPGGVNGIKLNYQTFWQSLTEPTEGNNDNSIALSRLLIDPQLIGLNKLPDMPAGLEAINMWNRRNDYLVRLRTEIKAIRISQGFNPAVAFGLTSYGPLDNVPVVPSWNDFWAYYNTLLDSLNSIDTATVEAAEKEINNSLSVSVEEFRAIMQLHQRLLPNSAGQITNPPTQDEYEKLYQILVGSYKRRVLYPEWRKYESVTHFHFYDTNIPVDREWQNYWLSSKAKLPKWRASVAERQEWLNALASRSIRPIIDPDLVFLNDIKDPTNPAYGIWKNRVEIIQDEIIDDLPYNPSAIEDDITEALEINPADIYGFTYLLSADEAGEDIRPRLAQLHITYQGFSRLKVLVGVGYANMTPDELKEFQNILVQAIKIRDYYAAWRDEESDLPDQDDTITLSPDFFKINPPAYNSNPIAFYEELPQWRATWQERTNWVQTLTARIEQLKDVETNVKNIIEETEKQVLPIIRDGLVMLCGQEYAALQDNAKALETRLLVDFSINCCQETTRVSHAIDVLQKLLWSESLGIDKNIQINPTTTLEFVLDADNFEEEWKWLGSYTTWRAAMFVFMYPENLLLPSLRRYQSPAFIKLVNEVQGTNRLTPLDACRAAKEYSQYYEDIANLEPEATCNTQVLIHNDICLNKNPVVPLDIFYAFATGKKSEQAYWHSKLLSGDTMDDYSFWSPIEGLGKNVTKIVGCSIYSTDDSIRHIYLFATIYQDLEDKLVYIRYDLQKQTWDNEYTELNIPDDTDYSRILVMQRIRETEPPKVLIQGYIYKAMYVNCLNRKGKDWESDDWVEVTAHTYGNSIETVHAYIETYETVGDRNMFEEFIVAKFYDDNAIWYRFMAENAWVPNSIEHKSGSLRFDYNDDGEWRKLIKPVINEVIEGKYIGAIIPSPGKKDVAVLYFGNRERQVVIRSAPKQQVYRVDSIESLDNWIKKWINTSLSSFIASEEDANFWLYGLQLLVRVYNADSTYRSRYYSDISNLNKYTADIMGMFQIVADYGACLSYYFDLNYGVLKEIYDSNESLRDKIDAFGGKGKLQEIKEKYIDHLKKIADWLVEDYIKNSNESRAKDYKWVNQKITDAIMPGYYNWDDSYAKEKAGKHLGGVLRNILNGYYMKWEDHVTHEEYPNANSGWRKDAKEESRQNWDNYIDNWITRFYGGFREDDYISVSQDVLSITGARVIVPNAGKLEDSIGLRAMIRDSGTTGNFSIAFRGNPVLANRIYQYLAHINGGYRLSPYIPTPLLPITEEMTSDELALKASTICGIVQANNAPYDPAINQEYLREAWYFVPMLLGVQLSQAGQYEAALKWLRTVYDYKTDFPVYYTLGLDFGDGNNANDWIRNMTDWLLDPLNPHAIALGRKNNYLKYTIFNIAQTFKTYADAQFTLDTVETVSRAKELYHTAEELMNKDLFKLKPDECFIDWNETVEHTFCLIESEPGTTIFRPGITGVYDKLRTKITDSGELNTHLTATQTLLTADVGTPGFNMSSNLVAASSYVDGLTPTPSGIALQSVLDGVDTHLDNMSAAAMSLTNVELAGVSMARQINSGFSQAVTQITAYSSEQLSSNTLQLNWLQETKRSYPFDYASAHSGMLIRERNMSFSRPTAESAYTVAANMNPQAALDVIDKYPFPYVPNNIGGKDFCVAPNPIYDTLKMSIQLNLFKIRNCMNIAGMKRELDPYAAPTDLYSGLPQIGANGQLMLPGTVNIRPTIYRYRFLLERAKQLANMAQQVEAAFLAALEKYDSEKYNMLKAKQDLSLAKATVKLKELQVKVSEGEVDIATLQKERSQIQVQQLDTMINAGLNAFESQMIEMYWSVASLQSVISGINFGLEVSSGIAQAGAAFGATNYVGGAFYSVYATLTATLGGLRLNAQISEAYTQAGININSLYAAQDRREQSWNYEKTLATQDIKIGEQQVKVAQDRVRVSEQDRKISELQVSNAEATIDFLNTKFTNADLYNWMSGVLEKAYSYFIQEAASYARLAQNQLAFERQELPQGTIQDDYWELPAAAASLSGGNGPDRRGLTGSTRLLVDITKLESYAIDSEKRKLQITKTISLAAFFPMEFQLFKETGQITFDTLMDYFDRDYPGHYLRLINSVKVNIVALVPPVQGIKATLTSSGISHVVIGGSVFQDVIVRRDPETIALSGNRESNGMFAMQPVSTELLNPFESSGVHSRWQLKMPKATNHFDFATIADVILTIDYTALSSADYEKQVQQRLATNFKSQRAFSFRNEFSDAFYQWTHADEFNGNREVAVNVSALDFPANLSNIKIRELKFYVPTDTSNPDELVFSNPTGKGVGVTLAQSSITNATPVSGQAGFNSKGIISTLTNGGNLSSFIGKSPAGTWNIKLNGLDTALDNDKIQDVIMVVTYEAETPQWI